MGKAARGQTQEAAAPGQGANRGGGGARKRGSKAGDAVSVNRFNFLLIFCGHAAVHRFGASVGHLATGRLAHLSLGRKCGAGRRRFSARFCCAVRSLLAVSSNLPFLRASLQSWKRESNSRAATYHPTDAPSLRTGI